MAGRAGSGADTTAPPAVVEPAPELSLLIGMIKYSHARAAMPSGRDSLRKAERRIGGEGAENRREWEAARLRGCLNRGSRGSTRGGGAGGGGEGTCAGSTGPDPAEEESPAGPAVPPMR